MVLSTNTMQLLFYLYVRVHVVETPDQYDDVIINGQDSQGVTGESHRTRSCLKYWTCISSIIESPGLYQV